MSKQIAQIKGNKKADCARQSQQSASKTSHHNYTGNETMNSQIVPQTVTFNNQELITFEQNGIQYTAMKPICENIGIDWDSQRKRIERDEVLNSTKVIMTVVAEDGKKREMVSLPIQMLNGWLFGIDVSRVKESAKKALIMYKRECYQALYNYWHKGVAVNPRRVTISIEQQKAIRTAIAKRCQQTSAHYQTVYTALYEHFNIPRYSELLAKDFDEALRFIRSVKLAPAVEQIPFNSDFAQSMLLLGRAKVEDNKAAISVLEKAMAALDYALETIKRNNATQYSVFENLNYQLVE